MKKIINDLKLEIYDKGGSTWFCDYYFYNGISSERGTTKASGYGYDKHSTATSNAINKFKFLYKIKNGTKWDDLEHATLKDGSRIYGLYKSKIISYGIGLSSVLKQRYYTFRNNNNRKTTTKRNRKTTKNYRQ